MQKRNVIAKQKQFERRAPHTQRLPARIILSEIMCLKVCFLCISIYYDFDFH